VFGRSIGGRISPTPALDRPAERMYLFIHETLRETAEQQYGASLAGYRDRLHTWAAGYQAWGWPTDTPMYLLRGYFRLLATTGDSARLLACATDRGRHDRMLDLTGGDALALTEITTTTVLIAHQSDPDLSALLRLALARDELAERNNHIPTGLPAVWVALGQPARATALANGITDPTHHVEALCKLIEALVTAGDHDRARTLASDAETATREIADPGPRAQALSRLAATVAAAGDHDRAVRLAREITDPATRSRALSGLAAAVAAARDHDRTMALVSDAETATEEITASDVRVWVPGGLVVSDVRAWTLRELVAAVATIGEHERAMALASDAETALREITNPNRRAWMLGGLVTAVAAAGDYDRAVRLAYKITDPATRVQTLTELVTVVAAAGEHDRARALASNAETATHEITDPDARAWILGGLVTAVATAGHHDRATQLAREITNPDTQQCRPNHHPIK
jgi:NOL1/NOP2/fmu family ribosome biogenesis protein